MLVNEVSQFDIEANLMVSYPMVSKKLRDIAHSEADKTYDFDAHQHHHCAAMGPLKTGYEELDELIHAPKPLREVQQPDQYRADNWQLNEGDKFARVEKLREEGNAFFKEKNYRDAINKYKESLGLIEQLNTFEKPGDSEWTRIDKMNIPLYLNLSQCYLFESEFRNAADTASEVLNREADNEKGAISASQSTGFNAEEDLNKLSELYPSSATIVKQQQALIAAKRQEKEQTDKSVYKKMLHSSQ
ncbi:AH receptor-interacting protein [Aphelenchoides bicaudatus]|nr:AH receptor-interacting protein [Aphelenchoides bicaudatus]